MSQPSRATLHTEFELVEHVRMLPAKSPCSDTMQHFSENGNQSQSQIEPCTNSYTLQVTLSFAVNINLHSCVAWLPERRVQGVALHWGAQGNSVVHTCSPEGILRHPIHQQITYPCPSFTTGW